MKRDMIMEVIALLSAGEYKSSILKSKRDAIIDKLKEEFSNEECLICNSFEDLEELISWNLSKNHTERFGVIKGIYSRTYSYMNEDKGEVLKWLKENYKRRKK